MQHSRERERCGACGRALNGERAPLPCGHAACRACTGARPPAACTRCWPAETELPSPTGAALPELLRLRGELRRLAVRRRRHVLQALDAATTLKTRLEAELAAEEPDWGAPLGGEPAAECERLRGMVRGAAAQARLDDLVRAAAAPLDELQVARALAGDATDCGDDADDERRSPALLLANHCLATLLAGAGLTNALPQFYLVVAVGGVAWGRVVVQVRADVAPRMARNFSALCCGGGAGGAGYRGCSVFQCWAGESVIAGDTERDDGRGGRSAFPAAHFAPDESRLAAVRGAVGMRRGQRRRGGGYGGAGAAAGLVGSQFRIVLREMRGFSAIFGRVVEGLPLLDRLSRAGDAQGKPTSRITIASCGRLA